MILAVAVLSIIITAPLGAIGIMVFGEKILDHQNRTLYKFKELREKLGLPRVGERVRNRRLGTVWKIIEEKERWFERRPPEGFPDDPFLVPAIELRFWQENSGQGPGTGKTLAHSYTQEDPSFQDVWEILYDW